MPSRKPPFPKTALLALLVLTSVASPFAPSARATGGFTVVSDIDDTVKLTHVLNRLAAVKNGFTGHRAFLGMSEAYREWIGAGPERELVFLSASPTFLKRGLHHALMTLNGFPEGEIRLRNWLKQRNIVKFKLGELARIAAASDAPLIVLGDDTERDPELLLEFRASQAAGKVAAIYIRRNTGRPLPEGVTPFHSAFDLALDELEAGRMGPDAVLRVGEGILAADRPRLLFPSFSVCPTEPGQELGPVGRSDERVVALKMRYDSYVESLCGKPATEPGAASR